MEHKERTSGPLCVDTEKVFLDVYALRRTKLEYGNPIP